MRKWAKEHAKRESTQYCTYELSHDVYGHLPPAKMTGERECHGDRWIEMSTRKVTDGCNHHGNNQTKGECNPHMAQSPCHGIYHDGTTACRDQRIGPDALSTGSTNQRSRHACTSFARLCSNHSRRRCSSASRTLRKAASRSSSVPVAAAGSGKLQ